MRLDHIPRSGKFYLISSFLHALQFIWPVTVLYFSNEAGIQYVGIWLFMIGAAQVCMEVPTGFVADKYGYRLSTILGGLIHALGIASLLFLSKSPSIAIVSGILMGLGLALKSGAADALVYESMSHDEYEDTITALATVYQIGLIFSAIAGGLLFTVSPTLPFMLQSIAMFGSAALLMPIAEKPKHHAQIGVKNLVAAGRAIFQDHRSLRLLIISSLYFAVIGSWLELLTETKLIEIGLQPDQRGLFIGGIKAFNVIVFSILIARIGKNRSKRIKLSQISIMIFMPLAAFTNVVPVYILVYVGLSVAPFLRDTFVGPMIQETVSGKLRASEVSIFSFAEIATTSLFFLVISYILRTHSTTGPFIGLALITLFIVYPNLIRHAREA